MGTDLLLSLQALAKEVLHQLAQGREGGFTHRPLPSESLEPEPTAHCPGPTTPARPSHTSRHAGIAVPQIDRQGKDFGVELLLALAIPAQQTLDGEGVAQIVQAGTRLLCLPAQLMTQRGERLAGLPIRQRFGPLVKEKRGGFGPGKGLGASSQIGVQGGSGTASQRHVTGLAPFSLPDRQYRFSRFPIRQLQPESLRDAQSRAGQQTQQRAKGQRIKALWRAELARCRQQGRLLFRRVDMYGNSPVSRPKQTRWRNLGARIKGGPEEGEVSHRLQAPRPPQRVCRRGHLRPTERQLAGQGTTVAKLLGMLEEVFQQSTLRLELKAQATATVQIKANGVFERARFHRRTSPGQGWATARSIGRLTLAYT